MDNGFNRRDFMRTTALGLTAVAVGPLLKGAGSSLLADGTNPPSPVNSMQELLSRLKTTEQLGVNYLHDNLTTTAADPVKLLVHTQLENPANCGRRPNGWTVKGGLAECYTYATLRGKPTLGNRSQWSHFSFISDQEGIARGEHGLVEMRLCRGTTSDDLPLRICIDNGCFYILGLNGDTLLAGDRHTRRLVLSAGTVYTLSVLLFGKAVFARLTGADVPDGALELVIADRRRFIPGLPGFGLRPNENASSGGLTVMDWAVTPVGPTENCQLGVIGDSITAGNDGEPEAESYVALTTAKLGQELVLNTGSGGSTTTLDVARFSYEIAPFQPKIVWIEGGTNDIGTGVSADVAFENMTRQAQMVNWGGQVVFSTVPPRLLPTQAHIDQLARLNRLIRESGRPFVDRHALVCDPVDPNRLRPEFAHNDHIHIKRAGHLLIATEALRIFHQHNLIAAKNTTRN